MSIRPNGPLGLRQIEVFRALMICGSVTGAAELLFISVPAVSRMLAHMEMRLGFLLFERVRGRLKPTAEAKRLYPEVAQLFEGIGRCNDLVDRLRFGREGQLRIAASPSLGLWLLPEAARQFQRISPDVKLQIGTHTPEQLVSELLLGTADLGVCFDGLEHPALVNEAIRENPIVFACPRTHRFAERASIEYGELQEERLIGFPANSRYGALLESLFAGCGSVPARQLEVRFANVASAMVNAGIGAALIDELSVPPSVWPNVVAVPVEPRQSITVSAVYTAMEAPDRNVRHFIEALRSVP